MKFYITDAFSMGEFSGNTASVILPSRTTFLDVDTMKKTSIELNLPDTAFVISSNERADKGFESVWEAKYYSATQEVPYCGHATLAIFRCLMDNSNVKPGKKYQLLTGIGRLNVSISETGAIMVEMPKRQHIKTFEDKNEIALLYAALNLEEKDIPTDMAPEILATGVRDLIIPVASVEVLNSIDPDLDEVKRLSKEYGVSGFHVFANDEENAPYGYEVYAHARNFSPLVGNNEEAATGAASGAMAYYMSRHGMIRPTNPLKPEEFVKCYFVQGEKMDRTGKICCDVRTSGKKAPNGDPDIAVRVGGRANILAKGDISISSYV